MNKKSEKKIKLIIFSIFFLFSLFWGASCSQVSPEVISPEYSVIFEYENAEANPNARMSFFAESLSEIRRYEKIKVYCENGGYIWNFNDIAMISDKTAQRAGNTNLVMPENEIFPSGKYEIAFINSDEKEATISMNVNYDSAFYNLNSAESEKLMEQKNAVKKIAIYDEEKIMIYFGAKTENLNSPRGIRNSFSDGKYYQDVLLTPGNNVACIMPVQEISLE